MRYGPMHGYSLYSWICMCVYIQRKRGDYFFPIDDEDYDDDVKEEEEEEEK